ncbi:hypothetical protein ABES25_07060 [Bacillus gobiensis]|uniref:hypothetical protein n=1 Tax=Bacillus gobiensis TaxID=1441095 RepID=UPI003D1D0412
MNIDQTKLNKNEKNLLQFVGGAPTIATINHIRNDLKSLTVYAEHYHEGKLADTIEGMTLTFEDHPAPKELRLAYINFDIEKKSYLKIGILEENAVSSTDPIVVSNSMKGEHGISGMAQMPQNVEYGEPMLIGFSIHDKGDSLSIDSSITNKSKDSLLKYDDAILYYAKLDK